MAAEEAPTGCAVSATLNQHRDFVVGVVFSPDLTSLASASCDGTVRLWALEDILEKAQDLEEGPGMRVFRGHQERIWALAFSSDGRLLASCGEDKTVRLWQTDPRCEGGVDRARLQHTGKDGCVCHVEPPASEPKEVDPFCAGVAFASLSSEARCVAFTNDSQALAVGAGSDIKLFSCSNGEEVIALPFDRYHRIFSLASPPFCLSTIAAIPAADSLHAG